MQFQYLDYYDKSQLIHTIMLIDTAIFYNKLIGRAPKIKKIIKHEENICNLLYIY